MRLLFLFTQKISFYSKRFDIFGDNELCLGQAYNVFHSGVFVYFPQNKSVLTSMTASSVIMRFTFL